MGKVGSLLLGLFTMFFLVLLGNFVLASGDIYKNSGIGINFGDNCLTGMGKGCFDYEEMIGISKVQNGNITTTSIAQDVLLAATYMVGTVLTVVIIYCGLRYIFAAKGGKDPKEYKDGLISAAIGALLVRGAYAIVRLIQYIAKG